MNRSNGHSAPQSRIARLSPFSLAAAALCGLTLSSAVTAQVTTSNINDAVHIWGLDTSGTPQQITGLSVEPFQGDPFTVIYADDNQGSPVTSRNPGADVAYITLNDGGLGSTNSAQTYVTLSAGTSTINLAGDQTTFTGTMDFTGATLLGINTIPALVSNTGTSIAATDNFIDTNVTLASGNGYGLPTSGSGNTSTVVSSVDDVIINTNTNGGNGSFQVNMQDPRTGQSGNLTVIQSASTADGPVTTIGDGVSSSATFSSTGVALSGNTTVAGNLGVTGTTTLTGAATVTGVTNINTTGTAATTVGNGNAATTVSAFGGNSGLSLANNAAAIGVTGGGSFAAGASSATIAGTGTRASNGTSGNTAGTGAGGITVYNSAQTVASGSTVNDALSGVSFQNQISGNTFVDGNMYINGTLAYVSSNSATTTVVGTGTGTSNLNGATQGTAGGTSIVMKGSDGAEESRAALTLTNGIGNTHGVEIYENRTVLSGGTESTTLTLDDNGATFRNSTTGGPAQVHGVADGKADYDAVNVRQLREIARGVASVTAIANVPGIDQGKNASVGVGLGNYKGQTAIALAANMRFSRAGVFRASVGTVTGDHPAVGAGASFSW